MGLYSTEKCIITGLNAQDSPSSVDAIEYYINVGNKRHLIRLYRDALNWEKNNPFFTDNKYILQALILNDKWIENESNFVSIEMIKELIMNSDYPKTPNQKSENLFLQLIKLQHVDGEPVRIFEMLWENEEWKKFYFKTYQECIFYIDHLESENLIKVNIRTPHDNSYSPTVFSVTFKGLSHAIKLQEHGDNSRKCFIAMSFNSSVMETREAIRESLIETGYEAILIDEQNIDSDRTINDEIIANLKRCKFCIADFTLHSNGVYFESGFALGQGKKVIYTCNKEEFKNAHFDIKPLQHIIYETPEQLKKDLINKIRAYID